jgi:hypothetical protein
MSHVALENFAVRWTIFHHAQQEGGEHRAPVLYGVTMQEPGASKLVSVRFGAG